MQLFLSTPYSALIAQYSFFPFISSLATRHSVLTSLVTRNSSSALRTPHSALRTLCLPFVFFILTQRMWPHKQPLAKSDFHNRAFISSDIVFQRPVCYKASGRIETFDRSFEYLSQSLMNDWDTSGAGLQIPPKGPNEGLIFHFQHGWLRTDRPFE